MKVTDLSHPFSVNDMVFPGTQPMSFHRTHTIRDQGYNLTMIQINSHAGTHTDAPMHFVAGGASLEQVPLKHYVGDCYIVDCLCKGPKSSITEDDLKPYEAEIREAKRVILATGWGKHVNTDAFYTDFPRVSPEAANYLVSLGVITLGVEPPTLHAEQGKLVHEILLGAGVSVIESLTNLEALVGKRVLLSAAPLAFTDMDGFPVRACAIEL